MDTKTHIRLTVSEREFDMIIAALRLAQRPQAWMANYNDVDLCDIASEHGDMLTDGEIDSLIERIN